MFSPRVASDGDAVSSAPPRARQHVCVRASNYLSDLVGGIGGGDDGRPPRASLSCIAHKKAV